MAKRRIPAGKSPASTGARGPTMDRRLLDRTMANVKKIMSQHEFSTLDEANEFLEKLLEENQGQIPAPAPETPAEQAQELVYEALESKGKKRIELAKRALDVYPDCADAYTLLAEESARTIEEARDLYERAVAGAERTLGPEYFTDKEYVGHFWGMVETRPYMRARAALGSMLWEMGERDAAVEHYIDLLRLNPNDNQGLRHMLVVWLIVTNRDGEARELLRRYAGEDMAVMEYMRALLVFRQHGDSPKASKALRKAFARNPFVPMYMVRARKMPEMPNHYGHADENEAVATIHYSIEAWLETPEAVEWLGREILALGRESARA